jgi:glyoxylase-like metal-dependent hydrolase (beta-lactamase superfamily II)
MTQSSTAADAPASPAEPFAVAGPPAEPAAVVEPIAVAEGILRLKIPVPIKELAFVNAYALDDGDGWTLVDVGFGDAPTRALWSDLLAHGSLAERPIRRIVVTHYHPDHYGAAGWLSRMVGAPILMLPEGHALAARLAGTDPTEAAEAAARHYRRCGFSPDEAAEMAQNGRGLSRTYPDLVDDVVPLDPAAPLRAGGTDWTVIETAGHSPFHACLWSAERDTLIVGDQILPKISPNVGVAWWNPELDGVGAFLEANARLVATVGDPLVLPGHNEPFRGIAGRAAEIAGQHEQRLAAAVAAAEAPVRVRDVLPFLFKRPLAGFHLLLATGEALSHLNHLVATARLVRTEEDGVWFFRRA